MCRAEGSNGCKPFVPEAEKINNPAGCISGRHLFRNRNVIDKSLFDLGMRVGKKRKMIK